MEEGPHLTDALLPGAFLGAGAAEREQQGAAVAALLGLLPPPSDTTAVARYQALLTPGPAPTAGVIQVRVEYTCVDASSRYLVCGCVCVLQSSISFVSGGSVVGSHH